MRETWELAHKNEELQYFVGVLSEKWERMERDISVNYMSLEGQLDMLREELSQQYEDLDDRVCYLVTSSSRGNYRGPRGGSGGGDHGRGRRRGRGPPMKISPSNRASKFTSHWTHSL